MKVIQRVLSLNLILDLSHTSHLNVGFTGIEIKTEIWISFISADRVRKGSAIGFLSQGNLGLLNGQRIYSNEHLLWHHQLKLLKMMMC